MPVLLKMKYTDASGVELNGEVGPKELLIPHIHTPEKINTVSIATIIEDKLEEYNWQDLGLTTVVLEWEILRFWYIH